MFGEPTAPVPLEGSQGTRPSTKLVSHTMEKRSGRDWRSPAARTLALAVAFALLPWGQGSAAAQASLHPQLGGVLRNRLGEVRLESGEERRYELGAYAEILARFDVRPFDGADDLTKGFEARSWFAHSLALDTKSAGNSSTSRFVRFGADFGWLAPVGHGLELGIAAGLVFDGYYLGTRTPFPSTRYLSIRPALRVRQAIRGEKLALDLDAAYRAVVFQRGLTGRFGSDARVRAFDLAGAVTGALGGFTWALRLTWVSYLFELDGDAGEVRGADGSDHSIRMEVLVGWKLGT